MNNSQAIIDNLLMGYTREDIIDMLKEEGDKKAPKTFDSAMADMVKNTGASSIHAAWHISALRLIYRKNMEINDFKTAHAVLRDIAVITGLYAESEHENTLSSIFEA